MTEIDIVIVNWNAGQRLKQCLQSVRQFGGPYVGSLVIVDNASTDGSLGDSLRVGDVLVRNQHNLGFGTACNQGARVGSAPYILFLNPDARLFSGTLDKLMELASDPQHADVAIFGPRLLDEVGEVARSCARQPRPAQMWARVLGLHRFRSLGLGYTMEDWDHAESRDVEHVIGACYLIRRSLFEKLGGFDERFFVYLEDLDLSRRVLASGWRIRFVAEAEAFHEGGGTSRQVKGRRLFYSLRSRIQFAFKHYTVPSACGIAFATLVIEPCLRLGKALARVRLDEVRETAEGFALLHRDLLRSALSYVASHGTRARHID